MLGFMFPTDGVGQSLSFASTNFLQDLDSRERPESENDRAFRLFHEGRYAEAVALARVIDANLGEFSVQEQWPILIIEAQLATGDYSDAQKSLDLALERFPNSIRLRWTGIDVCRFNSNESRADKLREEIGELVARSSWRYRDKANQILLGKYFLSRKADAKEVLDSFFTPIKNRNPNDPEIFRAIGELAFEKHDFGLAADNFSRVVELAPGDADALCQLAQSLLPGDAERANESLNQALAINPGHMPSLLLVADQHISSERYAQAETALAEILKTNPMHPDAWAYRAVIAHLANDPAREGECRDNALGHWRGNPLVDHLIGRELSEKYRFAEGAAYQRRSLVYDKNYLPAKMQLANDLLRLGQELEGWKLADEVFDADQYSVLAHNLVTLRDQISQFRTLERDGFVVRMESAEADIYGNRVLDLLARAKQELTKKYQTELETPIFVEIFPRQQDFAIRTFGLPGGAGFLGVCFGRVITMNSPAAQGASLTSWESVLWHEFCHVVTLQKTKNKMPRWLSEGISVYEENLADPAWGEALNLQYRDMMLGQDLTPVSQLSGAFLRPASPLHLQFAYYESSLVVAHLIEQYGHAALLEVLDELSIGTPINDALRRHMAPVEFIDRKFAEFARSRAESLAPAAKWYDEESPVDRNAKQWAQWNAEHPDSLRGLLSESTAWIKEKNWAQAVNPLEQAIRLSPDLKQAQWLLVRACRELGETEKELSVLEDLAKIEADDVELFARLLEMSSANNDWEKTMVYAQKLLALNPLLPAPHRYLAKAAEEMRDDQRVVESLGVLTKLNPLDAADVHYRRALALHRLGKLDSARREVVLALERAPRYRDAHALLLKIVEQQSTAEGDSSDESDLPLPGKSAQNPTKESP